MTDTTEIAAPAQSGAATDSGARRAGLTGLRLPELQALAVQLGVSGTARMRKSELLDVIKTAQANGQANGQPTSQGESGTAPARSTGVRRQRRSPEQAPAEAAVPTAEDAAPAATAAQAPAADASEPAAAPERPARRTRAPRERSEQVTRTEQPAKDAQVLLPDLAELAEARAERTDRAEQPERTSRVERADRTDRVERADRTDRVERADRTDRTERVERADRIEHTDRAERPERTSQRDARDRAEEVRLDLDRALAERSERNDRARRERGEQVRTDDRAASVQRTSAPAQQRTDLGAPGEDEDDDDLRGRRGRRGRYRDRDRKGRRGRTEAGAEVEAPVEVSPDDVLVPVAGILDVLDNYAFIRTSGYLAGPNDVYVPLGQVKKSGLRPGDAVTGVVKAPRDGDQQQQVSGRGAQKFNALVRLDTVNGMAPDEARRRPEFSKLTPLYPNERLRLETEPGITATRIVDLVAPIGKGQRGLIVSPPKAGKTLMMQAIANAISINNPEVHLMVVLVDERPEEVTDMQRTVKGEVIASTFDRPASDHTAAAELAIERAKRLVELGHDVVVLLDSLTRLGRAYNLAAPASGRILSGGVDAAALYHPKKFFGAARNIENGGSLTIIASALVETGSKADEVIFEEFKGTGNMELRLDRRLADKRVFPAVDVNPSGTRREEILLGREELAVMWKLRRVLTALDSQQSLELLLSKMRDTKSNTEFLMQVKAQTPTTGAARTPAKD
ncbi:transcription termination factor Rho [Quadrisphaera oryzae]|uniref:transcription termination factor Rho n=1 Tax=Quadrisphaera TaxID=317661 RepID=UPI001644D2CE|nr:transcription termination factor Rho [Quadrisphaera sp. RL12-1S]